MKLRCFVVAAVLLIWGSAARAQVGLYLNPVADVVSNSVKDTSNFSFLGPQNTSRTFWGVYYGAYYDFLHANGLTVGVDLRGSNLHANNAALKDLLFGVRVSGQPFTRPWKPYVQASIGGGFTKAETSAVSVTKVNYRVFGGLDYALAKHVDVRAVEVGYGSLKTISSATVGNGGNVAIPGSGIVSISSGLVIRF